MLPTFKNYFVFISALPSLRCWVGFSLVVAGGATLHCGVQASHGSGLSCRGAQALGHVGSVDVARGF